jgi:hypothetical protein
MTSHITMRRARLKDFITSVVDSDDSRLKMPNPNTNTSLLKELLRFPRVRCKWNFMQVGTEYVVNYMRVTHVCVQPIYSHQASETRN